MVSCVRTTTVNCVHAFELAEWWKQVLGYIDVADDPNAPGQPECVIVDPASGHELLFIEVEELQTAPGRIHLDLVPVDRRRDDEVERVLALGARQVDDCRHADGTGWVVLADPEGNYFCILRSDEERAARPPTSVTGS